MIVKVCGMTSAGNIREVEALGVDLIGFIFYSKSPRFCSKIPEYLPDNAARVGVFVDSSLDFVLEKRSEFGLDYVQLHGSESPELCKAVLDSGCKVIKAFSIDGAEDLEKVEKYEDCCSMFLFDTRTPLVGGSGKQFDWSVLGSYNGNVPFLLSGGIGPDSVKRLESFSHPMMAGIDLNSRFESSPGIKDVRLLKHFLDRIYKYYEQDR